MKKEASWMTKVRSTSSLVMTPILKAASFKILIRERQSKIEMSFSMKKENGIGDHTMETTISFRISKKMA